MRHVAHVMLGCWTNRRNVTLKKRLTKCLNLIFTFNLFRVHSQYVFVCRFIFNACVRLRRKKGVDVMLMLSVYQTCFFPEVISLENIVTLIIKYKLFVHTAKTHPHRYIYSHKSLCVYECEWMSNAISTVRCRSLNWKPNGWQWHVSQLARKRLRAYFWMELIFDTFLIHFGF